VRIIFNTEIVLHCTLHTAICVCWIVCLDQSSHHHVHLFEFTYSSGHLSTCSRSSCDTCYLVVVKTMHWQPLTCRIFTVFWHFIQMAREAWFITWAYFRNDRGSEEEKAARTRNICQVFTFFHRFSVLSLLVDIRAGKDKDIQYLTLSNLKWKHNVCYCCDIK